MDQLGGSGKLFDGASGGERGLRGGIAASEVAGTAAGGGGVEAGTSGNGGRVAAVFVGEVCEMAIAGFDCVCGGDSADECGEIQEDGIAAAVCGVEVGVTASLRLALSW